MFLSFARRRDFHLWTSASDSEVREARFTLKEGQAERTLDQRHPFEFSVPAGLAAIEYRLQFVRCDGAIVEGGRYSIAR